MKREALINILQSQLDYMVSRMDYPLDVREIVSSLLSQTDGQGKILTVVDQRYFTEDTIKIIDELIAINKAVLEDTIEVARELMKESPEDGEEMAESFIEEIRKLGDLVVILTSMKKGNLVLSPEGDKKDASEEYSFITIPHPNRANETVLDRDVPEDESEAVLERLQHMERVVVSQLEVKGALQPHEKGNGIHMHGNHTIYKSGGQKKSRIQIRLVGSSKKIIAVIAITPPSEVHRNSAGESSRTALYDARERMLEEFLERYPKDENGAVLLGEEDLKTLEGLYSDFKIKLEDEVELEDGANIGIIREFEDRIMQNVQEGRKEAEAKITAAMEGGQSWK